MPVSGSGAEDAFPRIWSRGSITSPRCPSWLATRSATVRPKNPEPTTTRSGRAAVTPSDDTVVAPPGPLDARRAPLRALRTRPSHPPRAEGDRAGAARAGRYVRSRAAAHDGPPSAGRPRHLLARPCARGIHPLAGHRHHPTGRGGARRQRLHRRCARGRRGVPPERPAAAHRGQRRLRRGGQRRARRARRRLRPGGQPGRPVRGGGGRRAARRGPALAPCGDGRPGHPHPRGRAVPLRPGSAPALDRRGARRVRLGVAVEPVDGAVPAGARVPPGAAGGGAVGLLLPRRRRRVLVRRRLRPRVLHVLRGRRPRGATRAARVPAGVRALGGRRARGRPLHPSRAAPHGTRPPHQRLALPVRAVPAPTACPAAPGAASRARRPDAALLRQRPGRRRCPLPAPGRRAAHRPARHPAPRPAGALTVRHAVIMAGGSRTRLWPLSRAGRPKQLLDIVAGPSGAHSLLAEAFSRMRAVVPAENIWVCTAARYGEQVRAALPELGAGRLVLEPVARDTANAVGLAAALVADADPDAELAVVSADHVIRPVERFAAAMGTAFDALAVRPDALVTLGIRPTTPATGFGYVQRGAPTGVPGVAEAVSFREKPDLATAEKYPASGGYLSDSGMFVWRARTVLDALADHLPQTADGLARVVAAPGPARDAVLAGVFPGLPKISVDYAVLEPAATEPGRVLVAELDADWLDVGSWPALAHTLDVGDGNAVRGLVVALDSTGNVVLSEDPEHLVALVGVRDSVVVHTRQVTMVCPLAEAERVKQLLAEVESWHEGRFS